MHLACGGADVAINGRDAELLASAKSEPEPIARHPVVTVSADTNTSARRAVLLAASLNADILINNNLGPPPGNLLDNVTINNMLPKRFDNDRQKLWPN